MIYGHGLLARGFEKLSHDSLFLCSGVSCSRSVTKEGCARESALINSLVHRNETLVYTSSLGCYNSISDYYNHKLNMEAIVKKAKRYLIVRVGNLVGYPQNQWQFYPFIVKQVRSGRIEMLDVKRDIINIEDYVNFVDCLLKAGCNRLVTSFGAAHPPTMIEIVDYLESKIGHCEKVLLGKGEDLPQPDFIIPNKDYYKIVIDKYETNYKMDNR